MTRTGSTSRWRSRSTTRSIFSKYGGTEIKVGADEVLILRESDILAKVVTTGGKGKQQLAGATA